MMGDARRLKRARLIERLRTAEHRQAAAQAFEAEGARRKLHGLVERTEALAQLYAARDNTLCAADLRVASLLGAHLRGLGRTASVQAERAQSTADARLADLAAAERRRTRAENDRRVLDRALAERQSRPDLPLQRRTGTELE